MEENSSIVNFEKVHDKEIDDIWDIFFTTSNTRNDYMPKIKERVQKIDHSENTKPRRYMKFLFMSF